MQHRVRTASRRFAGGIDPWLTLAFLGLMCVGVLMVYSASITDAVLYTGSQYYYVEREVIWVLVGFAALATVARIDYRHWQRLALPIFGVSLLLLAAVLVPHIGHVSHGARRWFSVGSFITIEPSELIKLALIMYMASWLSSKGELVRDVKAGFVPFGMIVGIVALMIFKQPDLGTALVVSTTMFGVFYIAGGSMTHLLGGASLAGLMAWVTSHSAGYRSGRLTAFMNPWSDASGSGYHTVQALLALGSGGLFGKGLGNSTQKAFLPAPHTDSILAIIGEELGFVGATAVLLLFVVIAYRGMRIATTAPDNFGRLLAAGITIWITFQALLNFAVITSSVPFTGVPLPFVSYGGTSMIITMTAMGILLNVSRHATGDAFARASTDNGRGNRRAPLPRVVNRPVPVTAGGRSAAQRLSTGSRPGGGPVPRKPAARPTARPRRGPG